MITPVLHMSTDLKTDEAKMEIKWAREHGVGRAAGRRTRAGSVPPACNKQKTLCLHHRNPKTARMYDTPPKTKKKKTEKIPPQAERNLAPIHSPLKKNICGKYKYGTNIKPTTWRRRSDRRATKPPSPCRTAELARSPAPRIPASRTGRPRTRPARSPRSRSRRSGCSRRRF